MHTCMLLEYLQRHAHTKNCIVEKQKSWTKFALTIHDIVYRVPCFLLMQRQVDKIYIGGRVHAYIKGAVEGYITHASVTLLHEKVWKAAAHGHKHPGPANYPVMAVNGDSLVLRRQADDMYV